MNIEKLIIEDWEDDSDEAWDYEDDEDKMCFAHGVINCPECYGDDEDDAV